MEQTSQTYTVRFAGRLELNMWEFNAGALAFYEACGFSTYRRYLEAVL